MLSIITLKVGQLQTNCYLVYDKKNGDVLIIDPGDDAELIKNTISQNNFSPKMIVATHGHFDHIMAAFDLQTSYKISFYIHKNDEFLVKNMGKSAKYYLNINSDPAPAINQFLKDNDNVIFGDSKFKILLTPGHTPGSVCLYLPVEQWLFTGDTYFSEGIYGRTDFSYSSKEKLLTSITNLGELLERSKIFPGH